MKHYQIRLLAGLIAVCLIGVNMPVTEQPISITASAENITISKNLIYHNDVKFSEGELKLSGYEITINGDLYLTGGTVALGGGTLHVTGDLIQSGGMIDVGGGVLITDGSYRIEGEQPRQNSSGCLDINQADTVHVGKDFIMRTTGSNVLLKYSLAKSAEFTIGGDLYAYADGDCNGFCPNAKILVNFLGSQEHEIYFDNDESYLSNIGISCGGTLHFKNGDNIISNSSIVEISGTSVKAIAEGTGNLIFNDSRNVPLNVGKEESVPEPAVIKQDIHGDLNQDGKINVFDMILLKKYFHDNTILSEQAVLNADVNQNGSPDTDDLKQIRDFLHGRIKKFHEKQEQSEISVSLDKSKLVFYDEDYLLNFTLSNVSVNPETSLTAYITFAQAEHTYQGTLSMYLAEVPLIGLPAGQSVNWKLPVLPYGDYEIRLYDETTKKELDSAGFTVNSELGGGIETEDYAVWVHIGSGEFLASWDKQILLRLETEGSVPENAVILLCPEDTPEQIDFDAFAETIVPVSTIKDNFMGCFSFPVPAEKNAYEIRVYDSKQSSAKQLISVRIQVN